MLLTSKYLAMRSHMLVCKMSRVSVCVRRTHKSSAGRNDTVQDSMVKPPHVTDDVQEQVFLHRHEQCEPSTGWSSLLLHGGSLLGSLTLCMSQETSVFTLRTLFTTHLLSGLYKTPIFLTSSDCSQLSKPALDHFWCSGNLVTHPPFLPADRF